MDTRGKQMGTPKTLKDSQSDGNSSSAFGSVEKFFEYIRGKSREFDMALRGECEDIQQLDHRREQSIQGSEHETFQSLEEALKKLREAHYFNWDTDPTGHG
jgi:hypothetical protein